jgi:hypothetical protein
VVPNADRLLARITLQSLSDPQFRVPAIPIRHVDQTGDTADQGVLVTCQDAIGIGDLPQHLDNAETFFIAKIVDHDLGEMKQIRRLKRTFFCCLDATSDLALI